MTIASSNSLTPFEQGYAAFLAGVSVAENPFDKDTAPYSRGRWACGWVKARSDRRPQ